MNYFQLNWKSLREPNNSYDVFKDLCNLESYGEFADFGVLLVAIDHSHYINQDAYSQDTADFDFRHGASYVSGTELSYRTAKPYGEPIKLLGKGLRHLSMSQFDSKNIAANFHVAGHGIVESNKEEIDHKSCLNKKSLSIATEAF
ncbi:MAG: hypothetical protein MI976_31675 [Pseudomonadales bacterium]|nr:hypothetical protein [Pseudomonadales bacterium]